jgi:hypothetical protein
VGQPLADTATVEKASKIKLTSEGKTVLLSRHADNTWEVASYHGLPADFAKLARFAGDLSSARITKLSTSNPDKIARLEFKDTQIALLDSADKPLWSVTLGKNAPSGGRFLRYGDEPKAYLADFNAWLDTDSRTWADSTLLSLKNDDFAKVEITFPEGEPVIAARAKKEEAFAAEKPSTNEKLKNDKIIALLSSLSGLRFSDTSEPGDEKAVAARAHARTIKLSTFGGKTIAVALGRKPEEKIVKPAAAVTPPSAPETDNKDQPKTPPETGKPAEPVTETIPAGPVYAFIADSDGTAPVNALMQKRAYQISEYIFTGLPQKRDELFEPIAPPPAPAPASAPAKS